jgi:hypothetical protein
LFFHDSHGLVLPHVNVYYSKADYHITLTKDILENDAELRRGVKKVMEVIVDLLKDRVEVDDALDSKRAG